METTLKTTKEVETKTECRMELNKEDILEAVLCRFGAKIPSNAQVYVQVPGGGDWSYTNLEINSDTPIVVTWVVRDRQTIDGK